MARASDANKRFWNRFAARYAARPLKDPAAYDAMLADAAQRLAPTDRVLELGCGTGGTAIRLGAHVAQYTATDFSPQMIEIARAKPAGPTVRFGVADAETAFDGGPFDAICAFNLLHLVDDMPGLLAAIHANLKPGGQLISRTWCFADLKPPVRALFAVLRVFGLFPVARTLSAADLDRALLRAGFMITDRRVFGDRPHDPYIIAHKPA